MSPSRSGCAPDGRSPTRCCGSSWIKFQELLVWVVCGTCVVPHNQGHIVISEVYFKVKTCLYLAFYNTVCASAKVIFFAFVLYGSDYTGRGTLSSGHLPDGRYEVWGYDAAGAGAS